MITFLFYYQAFAQIHAGGKADGYASAHIKLKDIAALTEDIKNSVLVSPNPIKSRQSIFIKGIDNIQKIHLVDITTSCQVEISFIYENNTWIVKTDDVSSGIYLLYITTQEHLPIVKKILICP